MKTENILKFSAKSRPQDEALRNNYEVCEIYSPEPHAEVYGFKLNFYTLKLV